MSDQQGPHEQLHLTKFTAYIDVIYAEVSAIWQRYNAMLLANSLVILLLTNQQRSTGSSYPLPPDSIYLGGLFLCILWFLMTLWGWKFLYKYIADFHSFRTSEMKDNSNFPVVRDDVLKDPSKDSMHHYAITVIIVFIAAYAYLLSDNAWFKVSPFYLVFAAIILFIFIYVVHLYKIKSRE